MGREQEWVERASKRRGGRERWERDKKQGSCTFPFERPPLVPCFESEIRNSQTVCGISPITVLCQPTSMATRESNREGGVSAR